MHNQSLPPADRDELPVTSTLSGDALRAAVRSTGLSNSQLAAAIGKSDTMISQWLNAKYNGNVESLEAGLREWLRDRLVAKASGVCTIDTEISKQIEKRMEEVRTNRELGVITGAAGIGKSRGEGLYLKRKTLAIGFRCLPWRSGIIALAEDLSAAAGIIRLEKGKKRWDSIIEKTAGGDRLLVVDDAHELGARAFQCAVDYHEETGNPVCLIGLEMLKKKLLLDTRRARRVGDFFPLEIKDPKPLVKHLIAEIAPDANGESDALISLCLQVARGPGAFGAVEKQLKHAARDRKKDSALTWPVAFRAAHPRLLRDYQLTVN